MSYKWCQEYGTPARAAPLTTLRRRVEMELSVCHMLNLKLITGPVELVLYTSVYLLRLVGVEGVFRFLGLG